MSVTHPTIRRAVCCSEEMSVQELLQSFGDRFAGNASVKSVYGEPVRVGDRTLIPVANVRFGFGARERSGEKGGGGGGGGGMAAKPAGVLEATPQRTRFIPFPAYDQIAAGVAAGFLLGLIVAWRRK